MLAAFPEGTWLVALGVVILTAMTFVQRAKMKRRAGVDLVDKSGDGGKREARESMEALFVQLQEFSREMLAKLDMKVRVLNELLTRAEARIEELKRLSAPGTLAAPSPSKPANPLHEKVFRLADGGRASADIAVETGLERGEVELILGLRGKGA
ncbi:MAG: hypothetical protein FD180_4900 [Planctomycetota bacterium]|nr:MAG: hypothetical protein FD180_4900 [Planctomycetota bacterium]